MSEHRADTVNGAFSEALERRTAAIGYDLSRRLAELFPDRALVEGDACSFDIAEYAQAGQCLLTPWPDLHSQITTVWRGVGRGLNREPKNAAFTVEWRGRTLDLFRAEWPEGYGSDSHVYLLADDRATAEDFYEAVCEWCAEVRGEVLVFDGGGWHKSEELFQAIQNATFDNLVLEGDLKEQIRSDVARFFASRELYDRYKIPWKRGLLFIGPPGNGKTHTIKAVLNACSNVPCLYVKSFKAQNRTDHSNIRAVFQRARQTTPCLLVLEDLDSLIDEENRAFFLNELDGFAANRGIVTLATTNHPERLDPSIVDRPSRFDRKYHFPLPGPDERRTYIALWSGGLSAELRLSDPGIEAVVAQTEEFSFAYLKELFVSATMRWINGTEEAGQSETPMDQLMLEQADALRLQMTSMTEEAGSDLAPDVSAGADAAFLMRRFMMRRYRG